MGSGGHSSRKKSSSSSSLKTKKKKKKRTEDRRKKRSRSNRDESKKRYSDDDTSPVSYSTSDDYYQTKKSGRRSLASRAAKGRKRRAERSHSRSESSEDTRKRSKSRKKSRDADVRKKRRAKKRRREPSVDSMSSQSHSCSTCRSSGGDSAEKVDRGGVGSEITKRDQKDLDIHSSKSRHRPRSCSCSYSDGDSERAKRETRVTCENQPKRLKSVVSVPVERELTRVKSSSDGDVVKDEIVHEDDDYPSCRSNDSNDAGDLKAAAVHTMSKELRDLKVKIGASDASITKLPKSSAQGGELGGKAPSNFSEGRVGDLMKEDEDKNYTNIAGSKGDDLEAILRQKALENLRKFRDRANIPPDKRGVRHGLVTQLSNQKSDSVLGSGSSICKSDDIEMIIVGGDDNGAAKHDTVHLPNRKRSVLQPSSEQVADIILPIKDDAGFATNKYSLGSLPPADPKPDNARPTGRAHFDLHPSSKRLITTDLLVKDNNAEGAVDNKYNKITSSLEKEPLRTIKSLKHGPGSATASMGGKLEDDQFIIHSSSKKPATTSPLDDNTSDPAQYQTSISTPRSNSGRIGSIKTLKQASASQESSYQTMFENPLKRTLQDDAKSTQSVFQDSNVAAEGTSPAETSTGNQSTNDDQKKGDDSAQFQQKTMSVMRGGELVQVSYKVYIPKKAPALARRQLKR
ncbi:hypothetical protein Dimus_012678 [Dionaea muscipula]